MLKDVISLLRPYQYIKNIFVFAPMFFAFRFDKLTLLNGMISFILFSIIASSIYIFNDIKDINEDKEHPEKKKRPLASERLSINFAYTLMILLFLFVFILSFNFNINLLKILLIYFSLNIMYSIKLKHISIIDIFIVSIGFVLRLYAGSVSMNIKLSMWIIVLTFLLALFLALAKRRDDVLLAINGKNTRKNIQGYNIEFINLTMVLMGAVIIVGYILYTISLEVVQKFNTDKLYFTSIFVILGIFRYMQITFVEQKSANPTKIVLKDNFLKLTILFWLFSFILIAYRF